MLWIIIPIVVLVAAALVFYLLNVATRHIFITNYNLMFERTGSVCESLRYAIEVFRYRRPFCTLEDHDVDHLVEVFSTHSDPLVLADLFHNVDKRRDESALKDHEWVVKVANATEKNRGK